MITPELLERNGWEHHGDVWVLKGRVRLGWKENGKFYIGYGELPDPILSVEKLKMIYEICGINEKI